MADKKRKSRDENNHSGKKGREIKNKKRNNSSSKKKDEKNRPWRGPRLPNELQRELNLSNPAVEEGLSDGDEDINFDVTVGNDVYEYEEGVAEEESKKNKRFDPVENYEYELPEDFEDENVASDEGGDDENEGNHSEDDNEESHARMLQEITGLPSASFDGKKKKKELIISEAYPESEFNPSRDILDGDGRISIHDLLDPLSGKSGYNKLKKNVHRMETKSMPIHAPLPKPDQERIERKAAYEQSKKDVTKWAPLVKRNREASTIYFDEDVDLGFSTVGAMASEFEPRTDFEKKIASLVNDGELVEAHRKDGARLLELNKISIADVKSRQDQLARMCSLLFRHEMKAKRIKKIKSKVYHRLLKKDRSKAMEAEIQMDPEAAKELAMKQEFKRAEERMTLRHKNSSKWAKRILQRGLDVQDEGTRAAIAEQLHKHDSLTRKMKSMEDSSSDESSEEDDIDEMSAGSDEDVGSKLLMKGKQKTLEVMEGDEEVPNSGVFSLPFMVRELEKRKAAAKEEARLAVEKYESSLNQMEGKDGEPGRDMAAPSGRRVFGVPKKQVQQKSKKVETDNFYGDSDSEIDLEAKEDEDNEHGRNDVSLREVNIDPDLLREESEINHDPVFKSFEDIAEVLPAQKTNYEVAVFASNSWKKKKNLSDGNKQTNAAIVDAAKPSVPMGPSRNDKTMEEQDDDSDADSGEEMVDGILSSGTKSTYELPSQEELLRRAFAGDDVEEEFERDKAAVLDEENPEPEKPVLIPGWGQWTDVQKKRGLPSWMLKEHDDAKRKREEALKKRKDAHLNNVIISEKLDKKAEKLHTKTLPYPYTSKEVFEQSIRMPIGPEFNPVSAVGALNRPEVVKRAGVKIKPIQFQEINPHEKVENPKHKGQKPSKGKERSRPMKKLKWVKAK